MKSYETLTVGQIVADKYEAANVFEKYGIDYCCHGSTPLLEACKNANVELDQVQKELENTPSSAYGNIDFTNWPIDLLIDYILKIHQRMPDTQKAVRMIRVHIASPLYCAICLKFTDDVDVQIL